MSTPATNESVEMDRIVDAHYEAEIGGDLDALLATFADNVEHEVVGGGGPNHGKAQVEAFYRSLLEEQRFESIESELRYYGPGFAVDESVVQARATRRPSGNDGRDRPLTFRLLHIFEFADGAIRREKVWLDSSAIAAHPS